MNVSPVCLPCQPECVLSYFGKSGPICLIFTLFSSIVGSLFSSQLRRFTLVLIHGTLLFLRTIWWGMCVSISEVSLSLNWFHKLLTVSVAEFVSANDLAKSLRSFLRPSMLACLNWYDFLGFSLQNLGLVFIMMKGIPS